MSHLSLSHIEPEYQKSLIQEEIHLQQNSNEGHEVSESCVIQSYLVYILLIIWA